MRRVLVTHMMEEEDEDHENEKKDGRDCEEQSGESIQDAQAQPHEVWMT